MKTIIKHKKMERRYTYILLLAFVLTLGSCQKYLDIKKTSAQKLIETAKDCQMLLDDYSYMNTNYPSDGQASSDDYYLTSTAFPGLIDQESQDIYAWKPIAIHLDATNQWSTTYHTIYYANLVLDALTKDKVKNSADATTVNNIKGSALFFRAYALWNIAQLYAKPFNTTADQDLGIPTRMSPDLNDVVGRGTVKNTYDRIAQDLQDAVTLLNPNSAVPNSTSAKASRPNRAAAYAMLARVYLSMENYEQALINANASLLLYSKLMDYNNIDQSTETPFLQFNDEVLFQSTIYSAPNDNSKNLLAPFDRNGNPQAVINNTLYALYETNDLRKLIFFKGNSGDYINTYHFTGSYDPTSNVSLFNGIAVDEIYLIRSECYVRANNTSKALDDLNILLSKRWKSRSYINLSNTEPNLNSVDKVLAKVLEERRKELVMRGQRWTDLRRLNKDPRFKINLSRPGTAFTLPANDPRYTLLIPQDVINITGMVQNQR